MRIVEVIVQEDFTFEAGKVSYNVRKGDKVRINDFVDSNGTVMLAHPTGYHRIKKECFQEKVKVISHE